MKKTLFTSLKKKTVKAFTLIEMLMVLFVISVLLLLFVPNLNKQKDKIQETGNAAIVKIIESQADLYELGSNDTASISKLLADGSITEKQEAGYKEYYANHTEETQKVPN